MKKFLLMVLMLVVTTVAATAQTVTTDKRFVRGATMAFGRMTVTGLASSQIAEQGFCYSTEKAEPTVDDQTTKNFLTNNGRIYWLKDLTPATEYEVQVQSFTEEESSPWSESVTFTTGELAKGDINGEGNVDAQDASLILQYVAKKTDTIQNADINGDGVVDAQDASLILQYVAKKITW